MPLFQRERPLTAVAPDRAHPQSAAFALLYGEFFDPIYWYCRSRLGDASAAEDAASTVFTRALGAEPRYDDPSLRSWLFTIAHNVVANAFRAARPEASLESAWDLADPVSGLEETVIAGDEHDRLLDALRQLPEDQRRVVELRMVGLTGPEIARLLNRTHGAVKMLQLRAFARLRDLLADTTGNEGSTRHG
jgi:RNA polymerase sigma-70 factor (ECF subfamily)